MDRRNSIPSKNKSVAIYFQNGNGNPSKQRLTLDAIERLEESHDVIAIFNDVKTQSAENIHIDGYSTLLRNDEKNRHYAGGVSILFPEKWTAKVIEQECKEALIVELQIADYEIIIATCYNHPNKSINKNFLNKLNELNKRNNKKILLIGDFNCAAFEFGSRTDTNQGTELV